MFNRAGALASVLVVSSFCAWAQAQSVQPAVFVTNNVGDSVTSFIVNLNGSVTRIAAFPSGDGPQTTSLSPDGRFLAVANGTASTTVEELRIFQVNSDATLTHRLTTTVPDSPLDVQWVSNSHLAVTQTGVANVRTYTYDSVGNTFLQTDIEGTGTFNSRLHWSPTRRTLYANNTGAAGPGINVFNVDDDGEMDFVEAEPVNFAVDMAATHNGNFVYGAGGISGDDRRIYGFSAAGDGSLTPLAAGSFMSPGVAPKDIAFSGDDTILLAGHGTDATVQTFLIDASGNLTPSGFSFDVGTQGNLGDVKTLGNLMFVTHEASDANGPPGLFSFTINPDGSLTQNGPITDTLGARPEYIATWAGIPEPSTAALLMASAAAFSARRRR